MGGQFLEELFVRRKVSRYFAIAATLVVIAGVSLYLKNYLSVATSLPALTFLVGGILGIIMMRLVIGRLLLIVERYPPLVDGAFIIIAWVAIKLFIEYLHAESYISFEIPKWISLGLIVLIFGAAFLYARLQEKRKHSTMDEDVTALLTDKDGK